MHRMKILLTGPAGLFREGVAALLRGFAQDAEVHAADRLPDRWPDERKPDCIVMDGDRLNDVRAQLDAARERVGTTPVIVLLSMATREQVDELIATGVAGCVEKSASAELLLVRSASCWQAAFRCRARCFRRREANCACRPETSRRTRTCI